MTVVSLQNSARGEVTPHARELEILVKIAEQVRREQRGRAVVLHGPRGAGADALLTAWKRDLLQRREHVFDTECLPGATVYSSLIEVVTKYVRAVDDLGLLNEEINELYTKVGGALGIPRLSGFDPVSERPVDAGSHILFYESLGQLLAGLSNRVPATVILRNLHLADSATRAAVSFLVQNVVTDPVGSFAPEDLQRVPFNGVLALSVADESGLRVSLERTLEDRDGASFVNLRGATEETVRQFLMQQDVVARFVESSGGSEDNLHDLIEAIPRKVEDLFLRRCEQLGEGERRLLGAMAVFGKPIQPDLLLNVLDPVPSRSSLSTLLDKKLVSKRVRQGQLLVDLPTEENRRVVYEGLSEEKRAELHGRIAELLEDRARFGEAANLAELAHHYLRSTKVEKAVEYCLGAAERLHISYAYERAQGLLEGVLPNIDDRDTRREVLDRLIDLCACQSEHRRALFYCGLLKKELALKSRGPLYRRIGGMLLELGAYQKALRVLERARALVIAQPRVPERFDELVRIDAVVAEAYYGRGMYDEVEAVCSESLRKIAASPVASAQRQVFSLTNTLGKVHLFREDYVRASHAFQENERRAEEHKWPNEAVRARFNLGAIALRRCEYEKARETFNSCLSFGINAQNAIIRAFCMMNLGVIHHKTHAYGEALDSYLNSLATFKKSGTDLQFAVVALNLGDLYLTLGDLRRARALAETSLEVTQAHDIRFFRGWANHVMGGIALEEGRYVEAETHLGLAREILEELGSPTWLLRVTVRQARLHYLRGELADARTLLADVPFDVAERDGKEIEGKVRILLARLSVEEDPDTAREHLDRARAIFEELEAKESLWETDLVLAELAFSRGSRAEAIRLLKGASTLIDSLGEAVPGALKDIYQNAPSRQRVEALRIRIERNGVEPGRRSAMALPQPSDYDAWRAKYGRMIGENRRLLQIFRMIDRVADSDSTVLIQGESGTGKELIAQAVHENSARADKAFVKVNCAAFVETLLLSELFGHEKGAFTGALSRKKGRFELAHGGTVFLDEIGDISPNTQVALLRVLQERTFERVGGSETIDVDVRVIVATNRNIEAMVRRGEFRLDLYYRLKGVILELPPLRERREDTPRLLRHFVQKNQSGGPRQTFDHDALDYLARYSWPGNVRELENFARSMNLFVDDRVIRLHHVLQFEEFFADGEFVEELPPEIFDALDKIRSIEFTEAQPGPTNTEAADSQSDTQIGAPASSESLGSDPGDAMLAWARSQGMGLPDLRKWLEIECIKRVLKETEGNITKAAAMLEMKRPRLSQIINATPELSALKKELLSA